MPVNDNEFARVMGIVKIQADQIKMLTSAMEDMLKGLRMLNDIEKSRQAELLKERLIKNLIVHQ